MGDWSYNELNTNCLIKINENHFTLLLDCICLEFLDQNTFNYFLTARTPVFPNPSFSYQKNKLLLVCCKG